MTLKSKEDVAALRQSPVSFVLLYKDSAELNKFKSLADKHQDLLRFGVTTDASLLPSELGETKSFGLVWFNDGKEEFYGADQEAFDEEAVEAWMLEHRYPHFVAFDSASWRALSTKKKTFVVGAFNPGPNVGSCVVNSGISIEMKLILAMLCLNSLRGISPEKSTAAVFFISNILSSFLSCPVEASSTKSFSSCPLKQKLAITLSTVGSRQAVTRTLLRTTLELLKPPRSS